MEISEKEDGCNPNIPPHLPRNNRQQIETVDEGDRLYRRYPQPIEGNGDKWSMIRNQLKLRNDSGCLASLCQNPDDVRWKETGDYEKASGIFILSVARYHEIQVRFPDNNTDSARMYTLRCTHVPYPCLYPHAEVSLLRNMAEMSKNNINNMNVAAKELIRDEIMKRIEAFGE